MDLLEFHHILVFTQAFVIVLLALMLCVIYIPKNNDLSDFTSARKYLAYSYFFLGIVGFIKFFTQKEESNTLLSSALVLIIAFYQALLFTYTVLTLIQPLYVRQRQIITQLVIISIIATLLLLSLFFSPKIVFYCVFYCAVVSYVIQLILYIRLFRIKYNICLNSLEEYYEDDERARLRWVARFFYGASAIGCLALLNSLFFSIAFYSLFVILYMIFYAYVVCWMYNYQVTFKFAIPVVTHPQEKRENKELFEEDLLQEQYEQIKSSLELWVKDKKYTQNDLSVDEIANELGTKSDFLRHYFKTNVGCDFRTWRLELRIREAQHLMEINPKLSINQICVKVGIGDRSNFHRQFTKTVGLSPSNYREKWRSKA